MYPNRPARIDRVVDDPSPHINDRRVAQFIRCMLAERVREAARCFGIDISILQLILAIPAPRFTVNLVIPTPLDLQFSSSRFKFQQPYNTVNNLFGRAFLRKIRLECPG